MTTRKMALEMKLQKVQNELKDSKALNERLVDERYANESEIKKLKAKTHQLQEKILFLRTTYDEAQVDLDRLQKQVDSSEALHLQLEAAKDRNIHLEEQLQEAQEQLSSIFREKEESMHAISLQHELTFAEFGSTQSTAMTSGNKIKKYIKLGKFMSKTRQNIKLLKVAQKKQPNRIKRVALLQRAEGLEDALLNTNTRLYDANRQIEYLQSCLSNLSCQYEDSQKQLQESLAATTELLELENQNRELMALLLGDNELASALSPSTNPTLEENLDQRNSDLLCTTLESEDIPAPSTPIGRLSLKSPPPKTPLQTPTQEDSLARKTIVFSDRLGTNFGSVLNNCLHQQVTNMCYPDMTFCDIVKKICHFNFDKHTTVVIMVGNSFKLNSSELDKSFDILLNIIKKSQCKLILCALPYLTDYSEAQKKRIYKLNLQFYNLTCRHSDVISYFDINKFIYKYTLTRDTLYLSNRIKRQLATLVAYNIFDPVIGSITQTIPIIHVSNITNINLN